MQGFGDSTGDFVKDTMCRLYYISAIDTAGTASSLVLDHAWSLGGWAADSPGVSIVNETKDDALHVHTSKKHYAQIYAWGWNN